VTDPWSDPAILARAVAIGLLDAPQLRNNRFAPGKVQTRIINGACRVIDSHGQPLSEQQRIDTIFEQAILQKEQ
jgi:hypothetical protein